MAGLAAAASLSEVGFDVVLLEASNYFGGRVKQVKAFEGFAPIDLGGEFIHGSHNIINRIAEKNGWLVQPVSRYLVCFQLIHPSNNVSFQSYTPTSKECTSLLSLKSIRD